MWFKEEPSQFPMGQTAQSLTCLIMEKPRTELDECLRILLSRFRAKNSVDGACACVCPHFYKPVLSLAPPPCPWPPEIEFLEHACSTLRQSSNPVCGFSIMDQIRLCAVWPKENWLTSSMNHIQGWMTV